MIILPIVRGQKEIQFFYDLWKYDAYFCGGYIRYMCSPLANPVPAGDIDIYPKTWEAYEKITNYLKEKSMRVKFESNVAMTFWHSDKGPFKSYPPLQVIKPENKGAIVAIGTLEDIIQSFDFTIVRIGLIDMNTAVIAEDDFIKDETNQFLRIKNIHCPISSTLRVIKYAKKGYKTNALEILKLFEDWENRSAEYRNTLRFGIPKLLNEGDSSLSKEEKQHLANLIYVD